MNTQPPPDAGPLEDPVDRLRAADPAAGVEVDLTALDTAVRARIAAGDRGATVTALDAARQTRRPARWLSVAAAVAGVAVIGSGAFALGRHTGSTTPAAPAISLAAPEAAAGADQRGVASSGVGAADSSARLAPYGFGTARTVFSSTGLTAATGTATAWTYDSAAAFSREKAAAMASASIVLVSGLRSSASMPAARIRASSSPTDRAVTATSGRSAWPRERSRRANCRPSMPGRSRSTRARS